MFRTNIKKAKTNNLFSRLNSIKAELNVLNNKVATNASATNKNSKQAKGAVAGIEDEKNRKMKELDKLG